MISKYHDIRMYKISSAFTSNVQYHSTVNNERVSKNVYFGQFTLKFSKQKILELCRFNCRRLQSTLLDTPSIILLLIRRKGIDIVI